MINTESLATKYRPQTLNDFVGNEAIHKTISGFLLQKRFPSAVMLSGGTGLGKTTLARIIARYLVCDKGTICGKCDPCGISVGSNKDIEEVDVADERGIDAIRSLKKLATVNPMFGSNRVIILDEVHALTSQGASALLKTLEEPPARTTFILCTTDPHKVLATIRGRCKQFIVGIPTFKQFGTYLAKVAKAEGASLGKKHTNILKEIYSLSSGHIRDGVQILETLVALIKSDQDLSEEDIIDSLVSSTNVKEEDLAVSIIDHILCGNMRGVVQDTAYVDDVRALHQKLKWLVELIVNNTCGIQKFNPPILRNFYEVYNHKIGDGELSSLLRVGLELAKIEIGLNSGVSDQSLRYSLGLHARQCNLTSTSQT